MVEGWPDFLCTQTPYRSSFIQLPFFHVLFSEHVDDIYNSARATITETSILRLVAPGLTTILHSISPWAIAPISQTSSSVLLFLSERLPLRPVAFCLSD